MTILARKMEEIGIPVGSDYTLGKEDCTLLEKALTHYIEYLDMIDSMGGDVGREPTRARDLRDILEGCYEIKACQVGVMR